VCKLPALFKKTNYPEPPKIVAVITGQELQQLLKPYGINLICPLDYEYGLPGKDDLVRFLKWYKDNAPIKPSDYRQDNLDCDDFAWIMRAYFLIWCKGECPGIYIEASSVDENYQYPMHGFFSMVDWNKNVYFADHLEVAAPVDELYPAYKVNCQDAKV